ncbi:hypothetical protein [Flavobacterium sp.]|uniref:hypothetical protein n=1 Tax=Flavobacterium sp. TaxID=239 RepID=UPI003D2B334D
MKDRVDIKNFVNSIEDKFPVDKWVVNDIHIWPILRMRLHFYLINHLENKNVNEKKKLPRKSIKNTIKQLYYFIFSLFFWIKIKKSKNLFIASNDHRLDFKDTKYNRFFDAFIELNNIVDYKYIEYGFSKYTNLYKKENIYFSRESLKGFKFFKSANTILNVQLPLFDEFEHFLFSNAITKTFLENNKQEVFLQWFQKEFYLNFLFYRKVLKKINPDKVYVLCYYGEEIMALTAAANQLNIETIEYQHGPQVKVHLAYGSWSKIPNNGFDILPRTFWNWDKFSENVLKEWTTNNKLYKTKVVGNFWIDYWKNQSNLYEYKNYVLYCIQPHPFTIEQLFTEQLIKCIKSGQLKWFVRLHPRQINQMEEIKAFLKEKNILEMVNLQAATNDFLPLLLSNAKLHVTHYSGSALEAAMFGLKTVILNEIGNECFSELIIENKAVYIDSNDVNFNQKFMSLIAN